MKRNIPIPKNTFCAINSIFDIVMKNFDHCGVWWNSEGLCPVFQFIRYAINNETFGFSGDFPPRLFTSELLKSYDIILP